MTDFQTPKFPSVATPEEMKAASEKVVNFWVGALSPMWVPFWAASSFGLSAWAMTQSLARNENFFKDMPLATKWPGFDAVWHGSVRQPEAAAAKTAADVAEAAKTAFDPVIEAPVAVTQTAVAGAAVLKEAAKAATPAPVSAPEPTPEPTNVKPQLETVAAKPVPGTAAVTPKPIAKTVSAVRKPTKTH